MIKSLIIILFLKNYYVLSFIAMECPNVLIGEMWMAQIMILLLKNKVK